MDSKVLLAGIVGFLLGGLVVSIAATWDDQPDPHGGSAVVVTTP